MLANDTFPCFTELFVNAPHESISYIWQVFGCQHTLQPTGNDFEPPSIPALTLKGFVRWESIQILLAPEEHVPFVLHAVQNWHLKNPDTAELFPPDLSPTAFPSEPDPEITAWHAACGDRLKKEADAPKESSRAGFPSAADRVNAGFSHVPAFADAGGASRPQRPTVFGSDYFTHRSVPFSHVNPAHAGGRYGRGSSQRVSPERGERVRHNGHGLSPNDERARRRSFSDYPSPNEPHSQPHSYSAEHLHVPRPGTFRRHSHPHSVNADDSESDSDRSPRGSRRNSAHYSGPKVVPHFVHVAVPAKGPPGSPVMPSASTTAKQGSRSDGGVKLRSDGRESPVTSARRKTTPVVENAKDWAKDKFDKVTGMFSVPSPSERPRKSPASSGNLSSGGTTVPVDRFRDGPHGGSSSRHSQSHSYDDEETESEREHREAIRRRRDREEKERAVRRERERDAAAAYERERHRERLPRRSRDTPPDWDDDFARDRDRDRDRARSRRDRDGGISASARYVRRPDNTRRTSSHADIDRIDREKHSRMYDPSRDRDRYDDSTGNNRRRRADDRGRDRDRDRDRERGASPVIKGVGGRRYPTTEPPWTQESP